MRCSSEQISNPLLVLLIGNKRSLHASLQLKHLAEEVRWRTKDADGNIELVRLTLEKYNEFADRFDGKGRRCDQRRVRRCNLDNWCKVSVRPQVCPRKETRNHHRWHAHRENGVPVCR